MSSSDSDSMIDFLAFDGDPLDEHRRESAECQMVNLGVAIYRGDRPAPDICPVCELKKPDVATRRLNTMYAEDESNWATSCGECHAEAVEYYRELWDEYYNGLGV